MVLARFSAARASHGIVYFLVIPGPILQQLPSLSSKSVDRSLYLEKKIDGWHSESYMIHH